MAAKNAYEEWMKAEFNTQIDSLELTDPQKTYLRSRWLDQMLWMSKRADSSRRNYYRVKIITILAGVLVPVLVTSTFGGSVDGILRFTAVILGLLIAASNGLNEFFKYGDKWHSYRNGSEVLKAEWWYFYSLTGRYENKTHPSGFADFAEKVESVIRMDVKTYMTEIAKDNKGEKTKKDNG